MTLSEAIDYINAHTWSQWKLGLSRTRELLERLGDPQKRLRFVHVAGSNGKGSTCAMLERILREAGYVTGLYPSPYIEEFRERIQVCGEYIPEEALCRITEHVARIADAMEDHPTQFELITAIGMVYFAEKKCDLVVLEVGLGGTFDSTNVIDAPEVAVITNIGLEHTEYLGNTLAEIAGNKCGIIKTGSDVVCYENVPEVMEVVRRVCAEKGCALRAARFERIEPVAKSLEGQTFRWHAPEENDFTASGFRGCYTAGPEFRLALLGEYQLHNAATVLTVVEALRDRGFRIPLEAVAQGLANVRWPARFEVLSTRPLFILDGGHNPQCAEALAASLREYLPGTAAPDGKAVAAGSEARISGTATEAAGTATEASGRVTEKTGKDTKAGATAARASGTDPEAAGTQKAVFLIGMLADKDYRRVLEIVAPFAAGFICLTPDSPRALPAAELADVLRDRGFPAFPCSEAKEGIAAALHMAAISGRPLRETGADTRPGKMLPVVSFGSLYMAGAVRRAFPEAVRDFVIKRKREQRSGAMLARRQLSQAQREEKSAVICRILAELEILQEAKTVFTYASSWDEVNLDAINRKMEEVGKTVCYPVTYRKGVMTAVIPGAAAAHEPEKAEPSVCAENQAQRLNRQNLPEQNQKEESRNGQNMKGQLRQEENREEQDRTGQCQAERKDSNPGRILHRPEDWRTGPFGIREPVPERARKVDPLEIDAVLVPCVAFDRGGGRCGHGAGYYDRFLAGLLPGVPKILIAFDAQETVETALEETDVMMDGIVTESGFRKIVH